MARAVGIGGKRDGLASKIAATATIGRLTARSHQGRTAMQNATVPGAFLQASRMAGGAFGAAILGAIINTTYRNQLEHATSPTLARAARDSAVTGIDAANGAHSQPLLDAVRHAYVSGMNQTLWVSAALMATGAILAFAFARERTPYRSSSNRRNRHMRSPPDTHDRAPGPW